jgi:DNA repair protein RadC
MLGIEAGSGPKLSTCAVERAVLEGTAPLSDQELLALVLDPSGQRPTAWDSSYRLLAECGGIAMLSRFRVAGLARTAGVARRDALRVLAALELGRRAERAGQHVSAAGPLTAAGVFAWAQARLGGLEHEEIWVLCVDARTRLRSTWQAGRGGLHGCAVLARDVLVPVVRDGAAAFVLVHNHPSGDPTPSREDVAFTQALARAAATLSIPLLDHVVVTRDAYRSLLDAGCL